MEQAFSRSDPNLVHSLNAFLSAAQSVPWLLNKAFDKKPGYKQWQDARSGRLPATARTFKNLRNVSLKEEPVENSSMILGFRLGEGANEPGLGPHETFTGPWVNTETGEIKGRATVKSADGKHTREVDVIAVHDFGVEVQSKGNTYSIPAVITAGREYIESLAKEVQETVKRFA